MDHNKQIRQQRIRRKRRVRKRVRGSNERPRLSITRSHKHMYAQVIDDSLGTTLAAASTLDKDLAASYGGNADAARAVGQAIAERAKQAGIEQVCFDRGSLKYHGRVAALADAAREGGLAF